MKVCFHLNWFWLLQSKPSRNSQARVFLFCCLKTGSNRLFRIPTGKRGLISLILCTHWKNKKNQCQQYHLCAQRVPALLSLQTELFPLQDNKPSFLDTAKTLSKFVQFVKTQLFEMQLPMLCVDRMWYLNENNIVCWSGTSPISKGKASQTLHMEVAFPAKLMQ